MSQNKKVYNIGPEQQLLDLNGNLTNFEASFKVETRPPRPFDIAIVDQTAIDNNDEISYESIKTGVSSGTVRQDKNIPQNFYIAIRSKEPCECSVEISLRPIEGVVNNAELEHINTASQNVHSSHVSKASQNKKSNLLLYLLFSGIIGGLVYYMFVYKAKDTQKESIGNKLDRISRLPQHTQRVSFPQLPNPTTAPKPVVPTVAPNPVAPKTVPNPVAPNPRAPTSVPKPILSRPVVAPTTSVPKPILSRPAVAPKPVAKESRGSSSSNSSHKDTNALLNRLKRLNI
jgi:hypothetical protein